MTQHGGFTVPIGVDVAGEPKQGGGGRVDVP
jgi:hypothetical protein